MAIGEAILFYYDGAPYRIPMAFIEGHPDGAELMLPLAGHDIADAFLDSAHSGRAVRLLRMFRVGSAEDAGVRTDISYEVAMDLDAAMHPSVVPAASKFLLLLGGGGSGSCPVRKWRRALRERTGSDIATVSVFALGSAVAATALFYLRAVTSRR